MRRAAAWAAALGVAATAGAASLEVDPQAAYLGTFGLDVTVGRGCAVEELTVSAPPEVVSGEFEACGTVIAEAVAVGDGGATFRAGQAIVLRDGFSVVAGADFAAELDALMASEFAAVRSPAPIAERTFNARFHLQLDALALAAGGELEHLVATAGDGTSLFRLLLRRSGGDNVLVLAARLDGGGELLTPAGQEIVLPPGWNTVEVDWAAGAGDGRLLVSVNQGAFTGLSGLGNDLAEVEAVSWGAVGGSLAGSVGRLEVDGFSAWR